MKIFPKDSDAVLDYAINWSAWLDGDSIVASTWTCETGITIDSDDFDASSTLLWLSGGTAGESYLVTNHIVTAAGREDDRSIMIRCVDV